MKTEKINGRRFRAYDNGGKTCDRFTVVYMDEKERDGSLSCVGMSPNPFHPQGFGQHSSAIPGRHLGKRIPFASLPEPCQRLVRRDLA